MPKKPSTCKHDLEIDAIQPESEENVKEYPSHFFTETSEEEEDSSGAADVLSEDTTGCGGSVEEETVLPYSEREVARVLRFTPGAVTTARKRAGMGPDEAAYMPDARLSRTGVEKLLKELGIAIRSSRKKHGVDLHALCESAKVPGGIEKHSIEVVTCTVNRRLCVGVHCASGAMVRMKVSDNSMYVPGMEVLCRHVEADLYESLETPRAKGRF